MVTHGFVIDPGLLILLRRIANPDTFYYLIGHNYHGHYFDHAEDLSVNNYVRESNVCGIKVREW